MTAPVWFKALIAGQSGAFNAPWQMSTNSGASYAPIPTLPTAEINGPHGTQRFRLTFTIPTGAPSTLCITASGDIFSGAVLDPAEVVYDGGSLGFVLPMSGSNAGPQTFCVPATPGTHVVELWIGAGVAGLTNPNVSADVHDVMPCDCCPVDTPRCFVVSETPTPAFSCRMPDGTVRWFDASGTTLPVTTPQNILTTNIGSADGWVEVGGGTQPPNRTLPAPIFFNATSYFPNNGNVGTWIIEKTVTSVAAGAGSMTVPGPVAFPTTGLFADDNVTEIRVNGVLVPFAGLPSGNVTPQTVPVTWAAGPNTVRIVVGNTVAGGTSLSGRLIANTPGLTTCPPCTMTVTDLSINGQAFDYSGSFQEYLTLTPLATSMDAGTALTAPNHYHTDQTTPVNPCGGFSIGVTLPPLSAIDVSYGNPVNTVPIGDAFIQFRSPSLGGLLDFGVFTAASFPVGATRIITVPGGFARLTHVGNGPGSQPQGDAPTCGLTGNSLRMRNGNPIDLRLTFATC